MMKIFAYIRDMSEVTNNIISMTIQEWLNNDQLGIDIWEKKYRYNNESLDE